MVALAKAEYPQDLVTAEELWQLSGDKNYELVRGELVEMTPPGGKHGNIALEIGWLLRNFVQTQQLGKVMVETGFRLTTNPDTVRAPDVSFLSAAKIPPGGLPEGYLTGPPDLAVEIVSPHDTASEIQDKVQDYLAYGAQLVWVIYPQQQIVIAHHPDGMARILREADTLSGEAILPGFSCQVKDIFS
ncbi:MAG: Uma2 family endonuclease [Anaerolineae bacterium]|nr:Uma2 family endonuclease [Anaerolineae bacterium]